MKLERSRQRLRAPARSSGVATALLQGVNMGKHTANRLQRDKSLELLLRAHGAWVLLPELLAIASQYNARVHELRALGFAIENKTWWSDGQRHSAFRLILGAKVAPLLPAAPTPPPTYQQEPLFHFVLEHRDNG